MTDQISISTATKGTSTAAPKAQANGKGTGFLGMLMAAIGHKPAADAGMQAAGPAKAGQDKAGLLLDATAKAAAAKHQDTAALLTMAGDGSAQGMKAAKKGKAGQVKAGSLLDATAKAAAAKHQGPTTLLTLVKGNPTQAKVEHGAVVKHHDAKGRHHQTGNQTEDASGMAMAPAPATVLQAAAPTQATVRGDAQASASAVDTHAQAQGRASVPMERLVAGATLAAAAASLSPTRHGKAPATAADTSSTPSTSDASSAKTAMKASAQSPTTESMHGAAIAGQPAVDIAAAGMQAGSLQNGKGGTRDTAKASSHANAGVTASAGQAAKAGHGAIGMATIQADAHPQDAVSANSHAGSTDTTGGATARTSLPQTGIQSYSQVAGGQARRLPVQGSLITHADRAAGPRTDMPTASTSIPGQDPTAGNMAWTANPGIGQNAQAMANSQATMPQATVHASGPWTAMAAMAEIGQAAANGHTRLELKLEPAHLGKVHVRIDSDSRKNIQVHLVVEQPNSRQIIEQQLPNLRHALEQQGLNLGNFSMSSQQQGNGQGSGQAGQQAPTVSTPSFTGTQASTPKVLNAQSEQLGAGRLSIRI